VYLSPEAREAAEKVLRSAGFSSAWTLNSDDQSEIVFFVPQHEGDFQPLGETLRTRGVVDALMDVIPGIKIWVEPKPSGVPISRIF
jgi:hypothetical protein